MYIIMCIKIFNESLEIYNFVKRFNINLDDVFNLMVFQCMDYVYILGICVLEMINIKNF